MLEMMVFEQYGIPKEHNHLWYDKSHGFWDFPTWWENDDGSLNPVAVLMRVLAEELHGKTFAGALDCGTPGTMKTERGADTASSRTPCMFSHVRRQGLLHHGGTLSRRTTRW